MLRSVEIIVQSLQEDPRHTVGQSYWQGQRKQKLTISLGSARIQERKQDKRNDRNDEEDVPGAPGVSATFMYCGLEEGFWNAVSFVKLLEILQENGVD